MLQKKNTEWGAHLPRARYITLDQTLSFTMVFCQKTVQAYPTLKRFPHMFPWEFLEKILGMLSESQNLSFKLSKEGD